MTLKVSLFKTKMHLTLSVYVFVFLYFSNAGADHRAVPGRPVFPILGTSGFVFPLYQGGRHPGPCTGPHWAQRGTDGEREAIIQMKQLPLCKNDKLGE